VHKMVRATGIGVAVLLLAFGVVLGYTEYQIGRRYDVVRPAIGRATSPEQLARGAMLFRTVCADCHSGERGDPRPLGRRIGDVPAMLGRFYSRNLTTDRLAGVGAVRDEDLARAIRFGVRPDGHLMVVMPRFGKMGDDDIAAIIGFMRSGSRDFAPDPTTPPPTRMSLIGKLVLVFAVGVKPEGVATGVPVPPAATTAEYGRYVADALYNCGYCHTPGFDGKKADKPGVYGGGFELRGPDGKPVLSSNLTPHETGIGNWTLQDFSHAVRDGIRPDGSIVRAPMPRMRALDDTEVAAVWAYLRTLPPIDHAIARPQRVASSEDPAMLFRSLGCVSCHGPSAPFHDRLRQSVNKPVADVAAWIRNPERVRPGTQMPTYAKVLDERKATVLAGWVKSESSKELDR
jgi:mono/diheme cytochrome c family protein